ncbi:hypothetical protein Leryth_004838 [Lithospermum erythrorhizon]|uniref:Phospholipase A1 n=1 Tax=Lithospermum erythrorhizon TaxID=34254 RepID=A0AAV3RPX5_LITER|nr:hypothetical protein Leryth_004838 [Lithospermum erythrorhizon]
MASSPTWTELLGSNNWEGLLEPLDLSLRRLILLCGDMIQCTYDSFNNDPNSKYAGSCRYGKSSFFEKTMFEFASDYQVDSFLYATAKVDYVKAVFLHSLSREAWDRESNWIGYIAVTNDEVSKTLGGRHIYVVWRGTSRNYEWIDVFEAEAVSAKELLSQETLKKVQDDEGILGRILGTITNSDTSDDDDDENMPQVMKGWLTIYVSDDPNSSFTKTSARVQLLAKINQLRDKYKGENLSITLTGHSLGASLSILSAFDIVENGVRDIPVSAIVFGSPQVGNKVFNEMVKQFSNLKILHVRNKIDLLTLYPSRLLGYVDSGVDFLIDSRKSPDLKQSTNPGDWHNLQGMLHVVAGWNGENGEFELKVKRSLALVNKSSGFLKEEYLVPESWWIERNKGMVLDGNGEWILAPPSDEDLPVPED